MRNLKPRPLRILAFGGCLLVAVPTLLAGQEPDSSGASDQNVARRVVSAIHKDPRVDASGVSVSVRGGRVALSGKVTSLLQKEYAWDDAAKITGALAVVNDIEVMPAPRGDTDLAREVQRRLQGSPYVDAQGIVANARDGVVTLSGEADSARQSRAAERVAVGTPGVKEVRNDLRVKLQAISDQELANEATAMIDEDAYLAGLPISVEVSQGGVTLRGVVHTVYQEQRAIEDVDVLTGVSGVLSKLRIVPARDEQAGGELR